MATISDELAASIQQAFSQYYTDLSNQDQLFFGVGEVTITKQDGTTAVVPSWSKAHRRCGTESDREHLYRGADVQQGYSCRCRSERESRGRHIE